MSEMSEVKAPVPVVKAAAGVLSESGENGRAAGDERPISEIVSNLWLNTETLIRQELQLGLADAEQRAQRFKGELAEDVDKIKRELVLKAAGGAIAFVGLLSLTAALVLGLAEAMPAWLSALIVGVVIAGVGVALLVRTVRAPELPDARELMPKRAARSLKEDVRTIQEATK
jgi:hypothetical protein